MATASPPKEKTLRELKGELSRAELSLGIQVAKYQATIFEDITPSSPISRETEPGWQMVSSGGRLVDDEKLFSTTGYDLSQLRRSSYKMWRSDPHARAILRAYQKFVMGRDFQINFDDDTWGHWQDRTKRKLITSNNPKDKLLVRLVVDEFMKRTRGTQRFKEVVLRTARDGEVFVRQFKVGKGRIDLRFIEPSRVGNPTQDIGVRSIPDPKDPEKSLKVIVEEGIEHVVGDVESVTAYHLNNSDGTTTRIPAKEIIHHKAMADMNDLRGFPILEPVLKKIQNYEKWEEARVILNQVRTSVALVRRITGTQSQAAALIQGRASGRSTQVSQTESGRTEAMMRPGTVINAPPGVDYEFKSPNLEARDAGEDGHRFLLSVAVGVGMPEMLVTGDWGRSNYASAVEARTPAVREWEDWQDSFEPVFDQILLWILETAIEDDVLPDDTDVGFSIAWPSLITKDEPKQTLRNATLNAAGLLSRKTWASQEGLVYDDELERIAEEEAELGVLSSENPTNKKRGVTLSTGVMGRKEDTTSPDLREQRASALRSALVGLNALSQEGVNGEQIHEALQNYVQAASLLVESEQSESARTRGPEPISLEAILGAFTQAMQTLMEAVKHPPVRRVVRTRTIDRDPSTKLMTKIREVDEPAEEVLT